MKYGQNIVLAPRRVANTTHKENQSFTLTGEKTLNISEGNLTFNILVAKGSSAKLNLVYEGEGDVLEKMHITIEKDALLEVKSVQKKTNGIIDQERNISQEGELIWKEFMSGGEFVKNSIQTTLHAGSCDIELIYHATSNQQFDIYSQATHVKKSKSNMITKGIVDGESKGLSRGLIRIEENASGSCGYEKMDTLIFSGEADAIPNLEIHNSDVTCSHGATISKLDEEQLFYLQSRGMPKKDAKQMLVNGFLGGNHE